MIQTGHLNAKTSAASATDPGGANYIFKAVEPDLPELDEYLPLLREMHASGRFSNWGPLSRRFEAGLLERFGLPGECCVSMSSATAALSAAIVASGKTGPVLLPAFTFPASLGAVLAAGAEPIVLDVEPESWILDSAALDRCLSETAAGLVMLVKPFGLAADLSKQLAICAAHGASVIVDDASGLGIDRSAYPSRTDLFEVYSLQATKPFAVGEGGVVFAGDRFEQALRSASAFALQTYDKPEGPFWGFNGKMSELHAAVGLAQLKRSADRIAARQEFARLYMAMLKRHPQVRAATNPHVSPWQFFPLLMPSEDAVKRLVDIAAAKGVEIRRYYRPNLAEWPNVRSLGSCPVAADLSRRMCVLPVRVEADSAESQQLRSIIDDALALILQP